MKRKKKKQFQVNSHKNSFTAIQSFKGLSKLYWWSQNTETKKLYLSLIGKITYSENLYSKKSTLFINVRAVAFPLQKLTMLLNQKHHS